MMPALDFDKQVNYDNDNDWGQWNMAAKRRILMDCTPTPTSAPYFINPNIMGGSATRVSSLASTNRSNATPGPWARSNQGEDAEPYGMHSVIGPSMITNHRESNHEMDEEMKMGYEYAEEMLQMETKEKNLLDCFDVDLENTGETEMTGDWRKARAVEIEGKNREQETNERNCDGVITNNSGYLEALENQEESSVADDKKNVRNDWRKQWQLS
jgi:hypothetical protein